MVVDSEQTSKGTPRTSAATYQKQMVVDSEQTSKGTPRTSAATYQKQMVVDSEQTSKGAPRASAATYQKQMVVDSEQTSKGAPRASAATHQKQRELSILNRMLRALHAPALPPTKNIESVVDSEENFLPTVTEGSLVKTVSAMNIAAVQIVVPV